MTTSQPGYTQKDLADLQRSIAEGVLKVKYSDKEIEYRSLTDMLRLESKIKGELGIDTSCANKGLFGGRKKIAIHSKGL